MPNVDFISLIHSLTAAGEAALGEWTPGRAQVEREPNAKRRATAERSLRLLEALAEKTRGNLDREEAEVLGAGVSALRSALATAVE